MTKKNIEREEELALRRSKSGGAKLKPAEMDARKAIILMKRALESGKVIPGVKFTKEGVHVESSKHSRGIREARSNKRGKYDRRDKNMMGGGKSISVMTNWFKYKKIDLHVTVAFHYGTNNYYSGGAGHSFTSKKKWPMYRIYVGGRNSWGQSNFAPVPKEFDPKAMLENIKKTMDNAIKQTALVNQRNAAAEKLRNMGGNTELSAIDRLEELAAKGGAKQPRKAALEYGGVIKNIFQPTKAPAIMKRMLTFMTPLSQDKLFSLIRAMAKNETLKKTRKLSSKASMDAIHIQTRTNILFMIAASEAGFLPPLKLHMMLRYLKKIHVLDFKPIWTSIKGDIRIPTNSKLHPQPGYFGMDSRQFKRFFGAKVAAKKRATTPAQKAALKKGQEKLASMPPEAKVRKPAAERGPLKQSLREMQDAEARKGAAAWQGKLKEAMGANPEAVAKWTKFFGDVRDGKINISKTEPYMAARKQFNNQLTRGDAVVVLKRFSPLDDGKRHKGNMGIFNAIWTVLKDYLDSKPVHPAAEPKDGSVSPVRSKNLNPTTNIGGIKEKKLPKEREAVVPSPMQPPPPQTNEIFEDRDADQDLDEDGVIDTASAKEIETALAKGPPALRKIAVRAQKLRAKHGDKYDFRINRNKTTKKYSIYRRPKGQADGRWVLIPESETAAYNPSDTDKAAQATLRYNKENIAAIRKGKPKKWAIRETKTSKGWIVKVKLFADVKRKGEAGGWKQIYPTAHTQVFGEKASTASAVADRIKSAMAQAKKK